MEFVTELEAKLHAVMQEARDNIAALVKQFRSSAAVTDDQLQAVHDKLHAAIEGGAVVQEPAIEHAEDLTVTMLTGPHPEDEPAGVTGQAEPNPNATTDGKEDGNA